MSTMPLYDAGLAEDPSGEVAVPSAPDDDEPVPADELLGAATPTAFGVDRALMAPPIRKATTAVTTRAAITAVTLRAPRRGGAAGGRAGGAGISQSIAGRGTMAVVAGAGTDDLRSGSSNLGYCELSLTVCSLAATMGRSCRPPSSQ